MSLLGYECAQTSLNKQLKEVVGWCRLEKASPNRKQTENGKIIIVSLLSNYVTSKTKVAQLLFLFFSAVT